MLVTRTPLWGVCQARLANCSSRYEESELEEAGDTEHVEGWNWGGRRGVRGVRDFTIPQVLGYMENSVMHDKSRETFAHSQCYPLSTLVRSSLACSGRTLENAPAIASMALPPNWDGPWRRR